MKNLKAIMAVSTIVAVFVAAVLFGQNKPGATETNPSGKLASAPAWQLQDVDGKTIRSSDFKGKVVILDFWATWCGPCRMELQGFIELQKKYEKQGLTVIGVSVDQISPDEVKKFAQQSGVNYPVVLADAKATQDFGGIEAIPTTFVIDREGRIVKQHLGFTEKEEFEKEIKPLLTP
jgi:peroxiredoxin